MYVVPYLEPILYKVFCTGMSSPAYQHSESSRQESRPAKVSMAYNVTFHFKTSIFKKILSKHGLPKNLSKSLS